MDKAEIFGHGIASAAVGHKLTGDDIAVVREIVRAYPWFMTARIMYAEATGEDDLAVRLHYSAYGQRPAALKEISPGELGGGSAAVHKPAAKPGTAPKLAARSAAGPESAAKFSTVPEPSAESAAEPESAAKFSTVAEPSAESAADTQPVRKPVVRSDDIIDRFLRKGEYRIMPDEATPDGDAAAGSADFDLSGDLVSEELAQIYLAQGLIDHAKKIYERLSLLNPEKSVYFAEIIERIGDKPSGKNL